MKRLRNTSDAAAVKLSCVEIYGDNCSDLIASLSSEISTEAPEIVSKVGTSLAGISANLEYPSYRRTISVNSSKQFRTIMKSLNVLRKISGTGANTESSRSHMLLYIDLIIKGKKHSTLIFGDLAGSERAKNTMEFGNFITLLI